MSALRVNGIVIRLVFVILNDRRLIVIFSAHMLSGMAQSLRRVFVYGTLKKGEPNHHWLTNREKNGVSRFVARGSTVVKFPLVIGTRYNIPFLLARPGVGHHIQGEIYEVDDQMFGKLDELEDYPRYYDRELQQIKTEENE